MTVPEIKVKLTLAVTGVSEEHIVQANGTRIGQRLYEYALTVARE